MKKYLTEFIGTFFLVLTICLTVLAGDGIGPMAPLAIGCSLMIMVYMGGHISGGHYNPGVTLAVFMRGKCSPKDVIPYFVVQIGGAIAAAMTVWYIKGGGAENTVAIAPGEGVTDIAALLVEGLFTFALALVVLNTATSPHTEGNSFYGLAIGFTVVVAAYAGGAISGGAFNPAVGIGLSVAHMLKGGGDLANMWLYIAGPLAGGALAAVVFRLQHAGELKDASGS